MVSDPGMHSYKECLATVLWCWEVGQGMHMPWQHLPPSKTLMPADADMDERTLGYAAQNKLQRVAAYRQLQGYSNQLKKTTKGRLTLESMKLPEDANVRSLKPNEKRQTHKTPHQDVAYIVDAAGKRHKVLPSATRLPLLVLGLDQGRIGTAGCSFVQFALHYNVSGLVLKTVQIVRCSFMFGAQSL